MRDRLSSLSGVLLGLLAGILLWVLALGVEVQSQEPGLWTVRARRVVTCGLDYNGPPFTRQGVILWLACGEDAGWRLWPLGK